MKETDPDVQRKYMAGLEYSLVEGHVFGHKHGATDRAAHIIFVVDLSSSMAGTDFKVGLNGLKFLLQFDTLMFGSNKTTEGTESKYRVRDVWKHKDLGIFNNEYLTDNILPHGNVFLRLTPVR